MLTHTSEMGMKILLYLVLAEDKGPVPPRILAEQLGESPSYTAKTSGMLVKAGILRGHRGTSGGVTLLRDPEAITLLEIVEACQGKILGDYCQDVDSHDGICHFHKAMNELHTAIISVLGKWTLAQLAEKPFSGHSINNIPCSMAKLHTIKRT